MRNQLKDFIIHDSKTQYEKDMGYCEDYLFEIYGKTDGGTLFERDLNNKERILLHVGDGIKRSQDYLYDGFVFFRKNREGVKFFDSYSNYKDFKFDNKKDLSKEYIISVIKRYVYLESPAVYSSTCMGGGKEGVLGNPNWQYGTFILEDLEEYTVIKKYDTVKIFKGVENMYAFLDKECYCYFKLDEKLYENALRLSSLRRYMLTNSFGNVDISKYEEFLNLYKELDSETELISK